MKAIPSIKKCVTPPTPGLSKVGKVAANGDLKPPLKWAGGKRWQVPHLRSFWAGQKHRRLVEPFCGGLAVTIGLSPNQALLNDINPHLINFYRCLKRGLKTSVAMTNDERAYYDQRDRFNKLVAEGKADGEEAAALFYYLNRTGFNGLCRFNRSGGFNVPFGRYDQIIYRQDFMPYRRLFVNREFTNTDFQAVPLDDEDFVYADPPYDVDFTQYSKHEFGWKEQVRAAEWLTKHRGPVVLSNQATERIVTLYRKLNFKLKFLDAPRMISCTRDRTPAREVLAIRNV